MNELQFGQLIKSKAGRDKNKIFVIINIDGEYVYLVDGITRRLENPKMKKIKHVQPINEVIEAIKNKLENKEKITNTEIRKQLAVYNVDSQS